MNNPQWLWYAAQLAADDREQFELLRDMAEYNASFWNPEAVDQIRRARETSFAVGDKDFARQIEETFGRRLKIPEKRELQGLPLPPAGTRAPARRRMRPDIDPASYLETKLDPVRFIPLGE